MKPLYDFSRLTVDRILAPRDSMVAAEKPGEYFDLGRRALELIQFSAELCDKPHYPEILDLPCGHGRVLRWLRAHYEVGSLVTHLRQDRWLAALDCLVKWTRECGVIVFTTQGRCVSSLLARGRRNIAENIDKPALLEEYARTGFAYQRYFESNAGEDYGLALTSPEWLMRTLQRYPDIIMRAYLEEAWGMQDVVILYKKAGHYEPLLGVPEMNAAAPVRPMGWWRRLLGP